MSGAAWPEVALGDVADLNPRESSHLSADDVVTFVPMAAVDPVSGSVDATERRRYNEVAAGMTPFCSGDVLVAKITPCFQNGKIAHAVTETPTAFGSTEFHVVRPHPERADPRYVLRYLRQPWLRNAGERRMTGSGGQRRVPAAFLRDLRMPLPPIEEQRRIAAVLDQADELRSKRRVALALLDTLTESIFLDMFGDSEAATLPLGDAFAEKPIFGSMIPPSPDRKKWLALRVGNIQGSRLDLRDRKYIDLPEKGMRHTVRDGDLLMARAIASQSHLGKCVVAHPGSEHWAFDSHLMRLRLDPAQMRPEYLKAWLSTPRGRSAFLAITRRSNVQFNVNTKEIATLRVPTPHASLQDEFVSILAAAETERARLEASNSVLDGLFASLQSRAFRGQL